MHSSSAPTPLPLVLLAVGWPLLCYVFSRVSGWATLARSYRTDQPFNGELYDFRSGTMNGVDFRSCLTLGTDDYGLYLNVLFLFRIGTAPLLIPWQDVSTLPKKGLLFNYVEIRFHEAPHVVLTVSAKLGHELLRDRPGLDR